MKPGSGLFCFQNEKRKIEILQLSILQFTIIQSSIENRLSTMIYAPSSVLIFFALAPVTIAVDLIARRRLELLLLNRWLLLQR
jgi:hypothetical protein